MLNFSRAVRPFLFCISNMFSALSQHFMRDAIWPAFLCLGHININALSQPCQHHCFYMMKHSSRQQISVFLNQQRQPCHRALAHQIVAFLSVRRLRMPDVISAERLCNTIGVEKGNISPKKIFPNFPRNVVGHGIIK